jgi:hypothetical protein
LHAWTNEKAIQYQLSQRGAAKRYHDDVSRLGVMEALQVPSVEVFAFQEMAVNSGAPQNDKPIFTSVTSLMKAQSYEVTALPLRRKDPAVYQFNLLSVFDGELVRLHFGGPAVRAETIDTEHYIARYIVRKKETFSRIRFIKAAEFARHLGEYGTLHSANCKAFGERYDQFYKEILTDADRISVLIEEFRKKITLALKWRLQHNLDKIPELGELNIYWNATKNTPVISGSFSEAGAKFLNADQLSFEYVRKALQQIYRYTGPFFFEDDDIPF